MLYEYIIANYTVGEPIFMADIQITGIYYMFCNLYHILYGKLNSIDDEKENDAYRFAKRYKNNVEGFLKFIRKLEFSVISDYKESWEFVKQDRYSLERYTNFGLGLNEVSEKIM